MADWFRATIERFTGRLAQRRHEEIMNELYKLGDQMSEREDAARARQLELVQAVKDGWASLVAERDQWKAAAEAAGADVAAQVQAALDADSEVDAEKVEAANTALDELVNPVTPVVDGE